MRDPRASTVRSGSTANLLAGLFRAALGFLLVIEPGMVEIARATPSPAASAPRLDQTAPLVRRAHSPLVLPTVNVLASNAAATFPQSAPEALSVFDAPSDPAPEGSRPLLVAPPGMAAIAGRVLATDGSALRGVELTFGAERAETDADGLFLLQGVAAGEAVMLIDSRQARTGDAAEPVDHGTYEVRVRAEPGRTTALPWVSWLPTIDHAHDVAIASPTAEDVVARTPAVPGLELRIPRGAVLTDIDHHAVTHVGLTPIPVSRPPYPLPRNVSVPVYFTAQPGGAVISSADGAWLGAQVVYPNYANGLPKARGTFWRYEPDGSGWSPYGLGTVQADGHQVSPDAGTRIYALTGAMMDPGAAPPPGAPPPGPGAPPAGDPVDLASGFYVEREVDLTITDVLPLTVTRTYRPGDYNKRAFGVGMTLPYSMTLYSAQQYQQTDVLQADGSRVHYTRIINPANPTDNGYATAHFTTSSPGPFYGSHIDWNGNGWNLTRSDGALYVFGIYAPLQSIQDRFGNKITITRSNGTTGTITQVSSPNGRFVRFAYDTSGRIVQAVDNIGRTVGYAYDTSGRLSTVTDANSGVTTYIWDSSNRVQSIKDARGVTFITNTYDTNDRITRQVLADGTSAYQFAYTLNGGGGVTETDVTDPRGYVRKVMFNAAGYELTDQSASGTPQAAGSTYTRDLVSNYPLTEVDSLGRKTTWTYDTYGNVLQATLLAGTANAVTASQTYSVFNKIATVTDALGHTTQFQRDTLGRLTSTTDPLSHTTSFTYDIQGRPLTSTSPLGKGSSLGYNGADLASMTDALGRTATIYADEAGRQVQATDAGGSTQLMAFDPRNNLLQARDPNSATITKLYTPNGQVASVTDARNGQVSYTYDANGKVATRTDAAGVVSRVTQRDGMGNVTAAVDRKGQAVSFTYDPLNRRTGATYADGSTVAWTYDAGGRVTQVQDSVGGTVSFTYDALNRLLTETTAQGTVTYTYDAGGRRLTMQATNQAQVTYSYDNANHLTGIVQGSTSLAFTYDVAGRRTSATLPNGAMATYAYDDASQLLSITYASGTTTLGVLTYTYDASGRVVARGGSLFQSVLPGAVTSATYTVANRMTQRVAAGVTTSPSWDANGNLTSDGLRTYAWDARNRLTAITGVASYGYDAAGRRSANKPSAATATAYLHDGASVVQEQQNGAPSANVLTGAGIDERFSRTTTATGAPFTTLTDALGSTVALLGAGGTVQTSYGYDPYGVSRTSGAASSNPYQFAGRENDGTGLYYNRARYYNPAWGRFISEDPTGLRGGVNVYAYANDNPISLTDATGLNPGPGLPPWAAAAAAAAGVALGIALAAALAPELAGLAAVAVAEGAAEDAAAVGAEALAGAAADAAGGAAAEAAAGAEGAAAAAAAEAAGAAAGAEGAGAAAAAAVEAAGAAAEGAGAVTISQAAAALPEGITQAQFGQLAGFAQGQAASSLASTEATAQVIANLQSAGISPQAVSMFQQFYAGLARASPGNLAAVHRSALLANILAAYE